MTVLQASIGGRQVRVHLTLGVMCRIERQFGKPLSQVLAAISNPDTMAFEDIAKLLACLVDGEHQATTPDIERMSLAEVVSFLQELARSLSLDTCTRTPTKLN